GNSPSGARADIDQPFQSCRYRTTLAQLPRPFKQWAEAPHGCPARRCVDRSSRRGIRFRINKNQRVAGHPRSSGRSPMRRVSLAAILSSFLAATALTPASAGDMTFDRALNVDKEPQNWLLHHGNFAGHRFSALKDINTDNVKNLKLVFSVA